MLRLLASALLILAAEAAAQPLQLESLDGEPVTLGLREAEKALVVHFWATWCPECVEELPVLAAALHRCAAGPVRIVTVNVGESRDAIVRYLERQGLQLPVLRDPRGRVWRSLGGLGLPTNLAWTPAERRIDVGPRDAPAWDEAFTGLGCPPRDADAAGRPPATPPERVP